MRERIKHSVEQDAYLRIYNGYWRQRKEYKWAMDRRCRLLFKYIWQSRKRTYHLTLSKYCRIVILGVLRAWNFVICSGLDRVIFKFEWIRRSNTSAKTFTNSIPLWVCSILLSILVFCISKIWIRTDASIKFTVFSKETCFTGS